MDPVADELCRVGSDLYLWQAYSPKVKADLFSTVLVTPAGVLIVDPIPLAESAFGELQQIGAITGIIVTNSNHVRASQKFASRFSAPLFAHRDSLGEDKGPVTEVGDGDRICASVDVFAIAGAPRGEIALRYPSNDGTLIVGDALINFEPPGFSTLPKKYCSDEKEMRRSLRTLLAHKSERMLFAHGTPILSDATERLRHLLDVDLRGNPR